MKTSLIIPCYFLDESYVEMTRRCLASLHDRPDEIIVVDDGSPITPSLSDCDDYIRLETNNGYCTAVNRGLEAATGDVLIVGNNDLIFPRIWITELLNVLGEGFDIATCWTSDQTNVILQKEIEPNAKFGSLFAMRKDVYKKVGQFDEQFRGYFADLDYMQRAKQMRVRIGKNLNLIVGHKGKATYSKTDPLDTEYQRSMRLYEIKYGAVE